jgi:hypothetical protein
MEKTAGAKKKQQSAGFLEVYGGARSGGQPTSWNVKRTPSS